MKTKITIGMVFVSVVTVAIIQTPGLVAAQVLTPIEQLGKSIFFDDNLSIHYNQSCASCHAPDAGWTGPDGVINNSRAVYEGSIAGRFGNRKPPSSAYATLSPIFNQDQKGMFVGGNFWDGRATGEKLGNPAADQAQGPFLNSVEQALPDADEVVSRVCGSSYGNLFRDVWGLDACKDVNQAFDQIALSIAAFENSFEVNAFNSKFDLSQKGQAKLSMKERRGRFLFNGKGKCSRCHPGNGKQPLFTDFTFDNLGVPKNPENPIYSVEPDFVDLGLGGFLDDDGYPEEVWEDEIGKHKIPTLRNVDRRPDEGFVKAYAHNGYFKTLEGIVHFYNTRDVKSTCFGDFTEAQALAANCWPSPEVDYNVNTDELGNLRLTSEEEAAIVAFLKTLSDGFQP